MFEKYDNAIELLENILKENGQLCDFLVNIYYLTRLEKLKINFKF